MTDLQEQRYGELLKELLEAWRFTPVHPVFRLPTAAEIEGFLGAPDGKAQLLAGLRQREELIGAMENDPLNCGFEPNCWNDAQVMIDRSLILILFGGNGSSKTWWMAHNGVKEMLANPKSEVLWLSESELSSRRTVQAAVWHYLPEELKEAKRTATTNIKYNLKTGFAENAFTLPNGSIGVFGFYSQDLGHWEGPGWRRIYCDENLPLKWFKTLQYRLPRRGGKMVWGYTPVDGITPTIREIVQGAQTVVHRRAELLAADKVHVEGCPPGRMPYQQKPVLPETEIIYFFCEDSPFSGYKQLVRMHGHKGEDELKARFYGYARNTVNTQFPKFGRANIIEPERVPDGVTRYLIMDPAGTRNIFMIWVAVDGRGYHYIYREWPDVSSVGEWALPAEDTRRFDGTPGPAQPTLGWGVGDYKRMILTGEGNTWTGTAWEKNGETVFRRYMDPRSGQQETMAENTGGMSVMDRFAEPQTDGNQAEVGPKMPFYPAPGLRESQGLETIRQLLAWDTSAPLTAQLNEPMLYVTSNCANTIWALQNYTAHDGEKAACKDPVDCCRYMATLDLWHVNNTTFEVWNGAIEEEE